MVRLRPLLLAALAVLGLGLRAATAAPKAGLVEGRVQGLPASVRKDAVVLVRVKAWPGGRFEIRDHVARLDARGRFALEGVIPPDTRYGVYVAVVGKGAALVSRYVWSGTPGALDEIELEGAPAHPLRVRVVGDDGQPVSGVEVAPAVRMPTDGTRHIVGTGPRAEIVGRTGADGTADAAWFAAGDWAGVDLRVPGGGWERREFPVPAAKNAVVDLPVTLAATPDEDLRIEDDPMRRYFLMGPKPLDVQPEAGYALVLVLPGGTGDDTFHPWVRERYDDWVGGGALLAQLVAPKWTPGQEIVWPLSGSGVEGMQVPVEDFVAQVVADVGARHPVDPARVWMVVWSSSGPAAYRITSLEDGPVSGAVIAMSVFRDGDLASRRALRQRGWYLIHSPDDRTCPYRMAEDARDLLQKARAPVELVPYEGGHGWQGDSAELVRQGLAWLAAHAR